MGHHPQLVAARRSHENAARELIRERIQQPMGKAGLETIRLIEELDLSAAPHVREFLRDEAKRVYQVGLTVAEPSPSCRGLAYPGELRAAVLASLPEWVRATDQPAPARLRVDDIECTIDTVIVKREPIASTYVASYRQVNNPRFSLLQDQLRGIQDELSRGDLNASQQGAERWPSIRSHRVGARTADTSARGNSPVTGRAGFH